jgi:plasmid stability protein
MDRAPKGETKTTVWLPRDLLKRAKLRAATEGRSLRAVVVDALAAYLNRKGDR